MNTITETQVAGFIAWRLSPTINVGYYCQLLKSIGDPAKLLENPALVEGQPMLAEKLRLRAYRQEARATLNEWRGQGIGAVVLGAPDYPEELSEIPDPPFMLTYRGTWDLGRLQAPRLSIVGSRRADSEGVEIARCFASELVQSGACVVSGLALGVDGAAHRGALHRFSVAKHVPTIAVCGNGLTQVYPRAHLSLAKDILENGGLLISQFDPQEPPYPVNFLNRNRVIAGLSAATLVVQASDKSGSLVTARHALEFGKELFIVPGSIRDPRYLGSNRLLQHGAHLVTSPADLFEILPELRLSRAADAAPGNGVVPEKFQWLFSVLLEEGEVPIEVLHELCPEPDQFFEQILLMELDGVITRQPGNLIALSTEKRLEFCNNPL